MQLKDKIKFALDEGRVLVLGGQVLVSVGYQSVYQPGFAKLPAVSQYLELGSLSFLLLGLALVMAPAARDRLVEQGEQSEGLHRFATWTAGFGLLPFAMGIGVSVYVAVRMIAGGTAGLAAGSVLLLLTLSLWYGPCIVAVPAVVRPTVEKEIPVELKDKIDHALTEARVVLPGAQATLGFQFIAMLTDSFERLPRGSKYVHVVSVGMTTLTIMFLMTPAAFHRLVEHGEATERQHRVTTVFLLAAMATLPLGITGDLFVVFRKVMGSVPLATAVSVGMLGFFYAIWFGPGLAIRWGGKAVR